MCYWTFVNYTNHLYSRMVGIVVNFISHPWSRIVCNSWQTSKYYQTTAEGPRTGHSAQTGGQGLLQASAVGTVEGAQ